MASTNKTPQLGLNQWAAGDPVLREDFNGDNAILAAAVGALQSTELKCVTGSFVGDGVYPRKIMTPGKPRFLFFNGGYDIGTPESHNYHEGVGLSAEFMGYIFGQIKNKVDFISSQDDGFTLKIDKYFNAPGYTTQYFCLLS